MKTTIVALLFVIVTASGCAAPAGGNLKSEQEILASLSVFKGQSVFTAINTFGVPTQQTEIQGVKLMVWQNSFTRYYETSPPVILTCSLTIQVDDNGIVVTYAVHGNSGACQRFYVG